MRSRISLEIYYEDHGLKSMSLLKQTAAKTNDNSLKDFYSMAAALIPIYCDYLDDRKVVLGNYDGNEVLT